MLPAIFTQFLRNAGRPGTPATPLTGRRDREDSISMERKIFVLSLHRTGTQSVHDLFLRLGLRAIHWPSIVDGVNYQSKIVGRENDPYFIANVLAPVFARATA